MFSDKEIAQIEQRGSQVSTVEEQVKNFERGFPFTSIEKAATLGEGIHKLTQEELRQFQTVYDKLIAEKTVQKFVPASGAASRMFKKLFAFMQDYTGTEQAYEQLKADQSKGSVFAFFKGLEHFAFFNALKEQLETQGLNLEECLLKRDYTSILKAFLTTEGMDYGGLPKGLLAFHKYDNDARTAIEEHLVEGANYAQSADGSVQLHFTVSPEHEAKFKEHLGGVLKDYENRFQVRYDITFSQQKPSTDTIAVDMENKPFLEEDGSVLFRPGGHGALLENLNDLSADIIFIKNIDNVVPDRIKPETYLFKKVLGGVLLHYQEKIFAMLQEIDESSELSEERIAEMELFLEKELCIVPTTKSTTLEKEARLAYLKEKLNRPIRACGMVKNEGEPGGGPFWAKNQDGTVSLQVVESAQIDMQDPTQKAIVANATHFNPVDLVCALKDYKGQAFDLIKHRDPNTGFISSKSKGGRELKAQELPGLWNGAMADWNTIFVEVPIITFNPVKTVNDLLRDEHQ